MGMPLEFYHKMDRLDSNHQKYALFRGENSRGSITLAALVEFLDLMSITGYVTNIERGPGRHGIANALFLYILDPDGHRIEIYCSDYQAADPDLEPIKWDLKDPQRQTLWVAVTPERWFKHGTRFIEVDTKESDLKASPIIAP